MYTLKQRQIYTSPLNTRHDPLEVERRLRVASRGEINKLLDTWGDKDELAAAVAEANLVEVARTAFSLRPLVEKDGVSDADVLDTLVHFLNYLGESPSADVPSVKSQPCTDCQGLI